MDNFPLIITIIQMIVSVVLVALILMQESSETSGVFGGSDHGFYQTRRGVEKGVFMGTIVFTVLFVALALLDIVLPNLQNIF